LTRAAARIWSEQTGPDARTRELGHRAREESLGARDVQPSFSRLLLPLLRDEGADVGLDLASECEHGLCRGHLQVEDHLEGLTQDLDVARLDVPAILTQVNRDAVGSSELCQHGRGDRVGVERASLLPQGGYVVDVHVQAGHGPLRRAALRQPRRADDRARPE